jgi:hypothetical protein
MAQKAAAKITIARFIQCLQKSQYEQHEPTRRCMGNYSARHSSVKSTPASNANSTELANVLRAQVGRRTLGYVFSTAEGTPLNQRNVLGRHLHPALEAIGRENFGFHAFRRFRVTHLRKQRVADDLIRFWLGHADKTVTDGYSKLSDDVEYRQSVAQSAGVGFTLPAATAPVLPFVTRCDPVSSETVSVTA